MTPDVLKGLRELEGMLRAKEKALETALADVRLRGGEIRTVLNRWGSVADAEPPPAGDVDNVQADAGAGDAAKDGSRLAQLSACLADRGDEPFTPKQMQEAVQAKYGACGRSTATSLLHGLLKAGTLFLLPKRTEHPRELVYCTAAFAAGHPGIKMRSWPQPPPQADNGLRNREVFAAAQHLCGEGFTADELLKYMRGQGSTIGKSMVHHSLRELVKSKDVLVVGKGRPRVWTWNKAKFAGRRTDPAEVKEGQACRPN